MQLDYKVDFATGLATLFNTEIIVQSFKFLWTKIARGKIAKDQA